MTLVFEMMYKPRVNNLLLLVLSFVFACISWHFLSTYFALGSLEARTYLSKRPVVIQWDQYRKDSPFNLPDYLEPDTFANFTPGDGIDVVKDPLRMPRLYLKDEKNIVFPVYLLPKNSGIAAPLVRSISRFSSPEFSLIFSMWILGLIAYGLSLYFIHRTSGRSLLFAIMACLSPQIFFYLYSQYIHSGLMLILVIGVFIGLRFGERRRSFVLTGALGGMAFYAQLSSAIFIPAILLFNWPKIRKNITPLLLGFLPFFIFVIVNFDFGYIFSNYQERNTGKELSFYFDSLLHLLLDFSNPELWLTHLEPLQLFSTRPLPAVALVLTWSALLVLSWKLVPKNHLAKLGIATISYCIFISIIAREFDDDYYLYAAMGFYVICVLFFTSIRKTNERTSPVIIISLAALIVGRLLSTTVWTFEFHKTARDLKGCAWGYSCMIRNWNEKNLIGNHPLITLYFLEVGQIEFLSGEKIIPIHFAPRYEREPTEEEVADFLRRFPYREFRILSSDAASGDGRNLFSYMSPKTLRSLNLQIRVLRDYRYPGLERHYQLLKVTRL